MLASVDMRPVPEHKAGMARELTCINPDHGVSQYDVAIICRLIALHRRRQLKRLLYV